MGERTSWCHCQFQKSHHHSISIARKSVFQFSTTHTCVRSVKDVRCSLSYTYVIWTLALYQTIKFLRLIIFLVFRVYAPSIHNWTTPSILAFSSKSDGILFLSLVGWENNWYHTTRNIYDSEGTAIEWIILMLNFTEKVIAPFVFL